jgi:GAF domain-containing protein/CheY-like chemotaxis protein
VEGNAPAEGLPSPAGGAAGPRDLLDLAGTTATGASLPQLAERVARAAAALVPDAVVHVWLVSEDGGELRLAAELGAAPGRAGTGARVLPPGGGLAGTVVGGPEPVAVAPAGGPPLDPAWARAQGLRWAAGVRLARGERRLGALCVYLRRSEPFSPAEVDRLLALGADASAALEGAALLDVASHRLRRLEALREIEREISAQRDPDALVAAISRRAAELLAGDTAGVYLVDGPAGVLRPHAAFNRAPWMLRITVPIGDGVVGATAARRQGLIVNDYARSPLALPAFRDIHRAVVTQPLLAGDVLQGVIVVTRDASPEPFTRADLVQLGDFAVQASIALENARLLRLASARAERVTAAAQVGQLLAATRDADRIVDLIADKCREILRAEAFGLFRLEGDRPRYVRGFGLDDRVQAAYAGEPGGGVIGRAARERRAVETADVLRDPAIELSPAARTAIEAAGSRAVVAVPLIGGDRVVGVLAIFHPAGTRTPAEETEFLESLAAHAAVALENARLFAETRRRQETAEALATVTQTLTASLDLRTVVGRVAEALRRVLGADGGAIGVLSRRGAMRLAARSGLGAEVFERIAPGPGRGVTGWVLAHGQPFRTRDYRGDPRITQDFSAEVERAGIRAVLAVPVRLQDEIVGILYAFWDRPVEPSDEQVALAADLARVVAVSVANARLYEEARTREAETRALFDVGRLITSTLEPERVFDLIVEKVLELTRVRACGIFGIAPDGMLRYVRGVGLSAEFVRDLAVRPGDGTSGRCVASGTPAWSRDLLADAGMVRDDAVRRLVEREGYRAALSVPITTQGAPFGCLTMYWWEPHEPSPAEIHTLTSLATLAAVAIGNARLYDQTRRHVERLERLNQVNRAVSASLRLDHVLDEIARAAGTLFDAPLATLWRADDGARALARWAGHGSPDLLDRVPVRLPFGKGGAGIAAERREPLLDVPVETDGRLESRAAMLAHGIRTFSALPILLGDRLLGVLAIGRRGDRSFDGADQALVQALVGQAAVAIQNAHLYEAAREHEEEATRALDELRRTQEQLVRMEKLRALGEMASGVAHDFNNILAVILGRIQLLQRRVDDPTLGRWLGIVEQAALDGAQTVRQIQEFTRVRRDQPTQPVDLNQVVQDAVEMTRPRWQDESQSRAIDVQLSVDLAPLPAIDGQPPELREALTNLILNAVDALPRGGDIRIATRAGGGRVEVVVADTGIGMSDSVRRRVFEPFFSTKGPSGTGLGLAMVYGIVSRHGGEILVDSAEGAGATFTIRLPVGRSAGPAAAPPDEGGPAALRILVVDDEPHVRGTLEEMLRLQSHRVVVADDGPSGLSRFREGEFDLVMTDLAMPGMSGWQVAQAVKEARPGVPVVLVTGWGVELSPEQLRAYGVDLVLSKPFRYDDVRTVVSSFRLPASPAGRPPGGAAGPGKGEA